MNKEKQIEEMATLIYDNRPIPQIWNEDADSIAETLYNAGYRKQSENMVEVVRCKDCQRKQIDAFGRTVCVRNGQMIAIQDEDYCSYAERI